MNILHVIESVGERSGGTSTAFLQLLQALSTRDDLSLQALAHCPDDHPSFLAAQCDRVAACLTLTGPTGRLRPGALSRTVEEAIQRRHPDVVHLHGLWNLDLVDIARRARRLGIATIWQPHGMLVERAFRMKRLKKTLFLRLGLGRELHEASSILYCSMSERDQSVSMGPHKIMRVVPLPVATPFAWDDLPALRIAGRERFGLTPDTPTIVFMGRLHPVKRLDLTLQAFAMVAERVEGARLLILGDGDTSERQRLDGIAAELGIVDRVIYAGWVGGEDRWQGLAAGDVLTLNSMFENFGYVVPEAFAAGTPAVVTEGLAMADEVRAILPEAVCEPNAQALAQALSLMLARPDSDQFARRGFDWVHDELSHEAVASQLVEVYQSVAS